MQQILSRALRRMRAILEEAVRIEVGWPVLGAGKRPQGLDARDPADPLYDFSRADAAIKDARRTV